MVAGTTSQSVSKTPKQIENTDEIPREIYVSLEKRKQITDGLRLI